VEIDRQSIERRDFPTARRGYDPATVDAHLRALAVEVEGLAQRAQGAGELALGPATGTQVQGILDAAQATAAEIEREARSDAQRIREEAAQDAQRARAHVETLAQATAALRERVAMLDSEVSALALGLRAAGGGSLASAPAAPSPISAPAASAPISAPAAPAPISAPAASAPISAPAASAPIPSQPVVVPAPPVVVPASPAPAGAPGAGDLDGARLVALNMALSGESREQADRYLAESFELAEREKLLDEVYAAVGD
jgi:DivIVA domain-containing protein